MKKLILFTFLAAEILIFTSCLTVSKIERNCDKFAKVCITETVTETVFRDTTIYINDTVKIQLPADTVIIYDTVRIENNQAILKPVHKEFGLIGVNASINKNRLSVLAWLRDSTILIPRLDTVYIENAFQQTTTTNTAVQKERFVPKFYRFTFWFFFAVVLIIAGWIVINHYGAKLFQIINKILIK